uniref:Uncharacterized protein n=1 Tax=Sphaerodactylus townsendi TaxID=933632 RepID=A0ACB8G5T7_9SAUR
MGKCLIISAKNNENRPTLTSNNATAASKNSGPTRLRRSISPATPALTGDPRRALCPAPSATPTNSAAANHAATPAKPPLRRRFQSAGDVVDAQSSLASEFLDMAASNWVKTAEAQGFCAWLTPFSQPIWRNETPRLRSLDQRG